ncbi:MAG: endonuclease domain-containing protein [Patescibacteria group bacterium]
MKRDRIIRSASKIQFSRTLRKNQTETERLLWSKLRNRQLEEFKFRRQQQIGPYIADFICFEKKLIIELDGSQHNEDANKTKDVERTEWLEKEGYQVLRFWDNDIFINLEGVLEKVKLNLLHPHPILLPSREKE